MESPGARPSWGLVFQMVCRFHRCWAFSSKSTVRPRWSPAFKIEPVLFPPSFLEPSQPSPWGPRCREPSADGWLQRSLSGWQSLPRPASDSTSGAAASLPVQLHSLLWAPFWLGFPLGSGSPQDHLWRDKPHFQEGKALFSNRTDQKGAARQSTRLRLPNSFPEKFEVSLFEPGLRFHWWACK